MFACLRVIRQEPGGILSGIFHRFTRPRAELIAEQAFGAEYLSLTIRIPAGGEIDWSEAARILPRGICLLTPEGFSPPAGYGFREAEFPGFERQVLLRTACALGERAAIPIYRRVIGILDLEGSFAEYLYPLLRVYSSAHVVTQNPEPYRYAAERVMEELGAPVIIGGGSSDFRDCALVLCSGRGIERRGMTLCCPALMVGGFRGDGFRNIISVLSLRREDLVTAGFPAGIEWRRFAGAIYEYYGIEAIPLCAERLLLNGSPVWLEEASAFLEREAGCATARMESVER